MKKLMVGVLAAVAAAVCGAADGEFRVTIDGSESVHDTLLSAAAEVNAAAEGAVCEVALTADATFGEPVSFVHPVTLTSIGNIPCVLTRTTADACIFFGLGTDGTAVLAASADYVVTNLVLDGGVKWVNDAVVGTADDTAVEDGSVGAGRFVQILGGSADGVLATLAVSNNAAIRNAGIKDDVEAMLVGKNACLRLGRGGLITRLRGAKGSAVYLTDNATFRIEGGTFSSCSMLQNGAAYRKAPIGLASKPSVIMTDGLMTGNYGSTAGCVYGMNAFTMRGGVITGNKGASGVWAGDGQYPFGVCSLEGGFITNNVGTSKCGAIYAASWYWCRQIHVSGNPVLRDNWLQTASGTRQSNILQNLNDDVPVWVYGPVSDGAYIGVDYPANGSTVAAVAGVRFAKGNDSPRYNPTSEDMMHFIFDNNRQLGTGFCGDVVNGACVWVDKMAICKADVPNVAAMYTGNPVTLTVTVTRPDDGTPAVVEFATSEDGPWSSVHPDCRDVGEYTVWYRVTADGYETLVGSATIVIMEDAGPFLVKDNGVGLHYQTLPAAVKGANAVADGHVCELVLTEDLTLDETVSFVRDVTITSDAGGPFVLQRTNATAQLKIGSAARPACVTLRNVILDGGARWANAKIVGTTADLETADGHLGAGRLATLEGGNGALGSIAVAAGGVIRNVAVPDNDAALACTSYGGVTVSEGGLISNCRGGSGAVTVRILSGSRFEMAGGEFSACSMQSWTDESRAVVACWGGEIAISGGVICENYGYAILGGKGTYTQTGGSVTRNLTNGGGAIHSRYSYPQMNIYLYGGAISNNCSKTGCAGVRTEFVSTMTTIKGDVVIRDNCLISGERLVPSNFQSGSSVQVNISGKMGDGAYVMLSAPVSPAGKSAVEGYVFANGSSYTVTREDAQKFHYDQKAGNAEFFARVAADANSLEWHEKFGLMLLVR